MTKTQNHEGTKADIHSLLLLVSAGAKKSVCNAVRMQRGFLHSLDSRITTSRR
jgi:hypothetical protein